MGKKEDLIAFDQILSHEIEKEWTGCVLLNVKEGHEGILKEVNVCEYIGNRYAKGKLYFDPVVYPPPGKNTLPKDDLIYPNLLKYIQKCAIESGSPVNGNGSRFKKKEGRYTRKLRCSCKSRRFQIYKKKKALLNSSTFSDNSFRIDSILNSEKSGRRENGRALCRRANTKRSFGEEKCCNFSFEINNDDFGYYVDQTTGSPNHSHHSQAANNTLAMPIKLLPQDEKDNLEYLAQACLGSGVVRNYLSTKYGRYFERVKIAYALSPTKIDNKNINHNDVESLLHEFETSTEISYQVLWDVPTTELENEPCCDDTPKNTPNKVLKEFENNNNNIESMNNNNNMIGNICTPKKCLKKDQHPFKLVSSVKDRSNCCDYVLNHSEDPDFGEIKHTSEEQRVNIHPTSKVFICVAWSTLEEACLFKKHCSVIYCDVTGDSNNSKNHLLSFSGRTVAGKTFVFLRVWMHNQRQGTFRWVFKVALKTFIPEAFYKKVQVVLVDGDRQQRAELWCAINTYLSSAKIATCSYHLISRNWETNGSNMNCVSKKNKDEYKKIVTIVHNWLYSFTRPNSCENQDEYNISKSLLYKYINSGVVAKHLEHPRNVQHIAQWVRNNVLICEEYLCNFHRKHKRCFYQATTSPQEGIHFGMKSHTASMSGSKTLTNSAKCLSLQSSLKTAEMACSAARSNKCTPTWSKSRTSKFVIPVAESLLLNELERSKTYICRRIKFDEWEVIYNYGKEIVDQSRYLQHVFSSFDVDPPNVPCEYKVSMPIFGRVRKVRMDNDGVLLCNCCQFESIGIPCRHQACVIHNTFPSWHHFSHHDVSLVWWKAWDLYAFEKNSIISNQLMKLDRNAMSGPTFPNSPPIFDGTTFSTLTPIEEFNAYERVLNYSEAFMVNMKQEEQSVYEGLSQETFEADNDVDDDVSDPFSSIETTATFQDAKLDARDKYTADINTLFSCMDSLQCENFNDLVGKTLTNFIADARKQLRVLDDPKKRKFGGVVNIMSEAQKNSKRRTFHSRK